MRVPSRTAWVVSAAIYVGLTAIIGRDVIAGLPHSLAADAGDPAFTAGILYWNATHVPLTEGWWQLPLFHPTRDTLAFSEHLLGLSVISTPLYWLTGNPVTTYNLTMLLTFPLCAMAMSALVGRLTDNAASAFVAGLAFGFAPYRASQLSHVQVLAAFWAPLVLLGLHAYLDTRRKRWLALYAGAWLLQVTTNAYMLVLLSTVVGLWIVWFVVARRRWYELARIGAATAIAFVPLVPILSTYVAVHERHGLTRTIGEVQEYSADIASALCAAEELTLWSWLRENCRPEAELFPGLALPLLGTVALWYVLQMRARHAPPHDTGRTSWYRAGTFARAGLLLTAALYTGVAISVLVLGPWRVEFAFLSVSTTTIEKPLVIIVAALIASLMLAPGLRAAFRQSSPLGFYIVGALITWVLALGPTVIVMGRPLAVEGPFALLMALPGVESLRVPARFWLMTLLCLVVASAIAASGALRGRPWRIAAPAVLVIAVAVLADGWMRIPVAPQPRPAPAPHVLAGETVLELVPGEIQGDVAAEYRAITGGWKTINGYSGHFPSYYPALRDTFRAEEDTGFAWFQQAGALHVIVPREAPRLLALVERQPGAVLTAQNAWAAQYRLPQRSSMAPADKGERLRAVGVESPCSPESIALVRDGDASTRWRCDAEERQLLTIDMGRVVPVGVVIQRLGRYYWEFPSRLDIETSEDGIAWREARSGSVLGEVIQGGFADPRSLDVVLPFEPRPARFIRLRHRGFQPGTGWTVTEVEVWSGRLEP